MPSTQQGRYRQRSSGRSYSYSVQRYSYSIMDGTARTVPSIRQVTNAPVYPPKLQLEPGIVRGANCTHPVFSLAPMPAQTSLSAQATLYTQASLSARTSVYVQASSAPSLPIAASNPGLVSKSEFRRMDDTIRDTIRARTVSLADGWHHSWMAPSVAAPSVDGTIRGSEFGGWMAPSVAVSLADGWHHPWMAPSVAPSVIRAIRARLVQRTAGVWRTESSTSTGAAMLSTSTNPRPKPEKKGTAGARGGREGGRSESPG